MSADSDYSKYESVINGWKIVRKIGQGSIGRVYEIRKTVGDEEESGLTDRSCVTVAGKDGEPALRAALKVISLPDGPEDIRMALSAGIRQEDLPQYYHNVMQLFISEYEHLQRLSGSSHVVAYGDHIIIPHEDGIGGDLLMRLELLTSLTDYALGHEMDEADVLKMGLDISDALIDCEEASILHRDIKPDNIFVSEDGEYKLGDFGVARIIEETEMNLSHKGTLAYMAPEVYRGEEYGMASDIYSLGLVMYKYLNNGRLPFMPRYPEEVGYDDSDKALNRRIRRETLTPPENGSPELKAVVMKACAGNAGDRYKTAAELHAALESVQEPYASNGSVKEASDAPDKAKDPLGAPDIANETVQSTDTLTENNTDRKGLTARRIAAAVVLLLAVTGAGVWALIPKHIEDITGIEPGTEIYIGESISPEYVIEPDWFSDEKISFSSGDDNVFTVNGDGAVTAVSVGEAELQISARDYTENDLIRVIPKVTEIGGIEAEMTLTEGETLQLRPVLSPEKFSNEPLTYDAGDAAVAVISDDGIIAAVAPGETMLTLSAGGCTKEVKITVQAKPQPVYTSGSRGKSSGGRSGKSSSKSSGKKSKSSSKSSSDGYIDSSDDEYFD